MLNAIFRGISQLFFANSVAAGIIIIAGIAVCSRIAAIFALVGSTVGMLTGLALGANGVAIYNGLWGFNSFDAALAVGGVFFVLTWRSGLLAVVCAVLAALLFGAIASLFMPWGLPALTLPFVLRDAGVRPAEGRLDGARAGRRRGHHDARGASHRPRAAAGEGVGRVAVPA